MRYFFHLDDSIPNNDVDDVELTSLAAVQEETCRLISGMLHDAWKQFWKSPDWRIRVTDEDGYTVLTMSVTAVTSKPDDGGPRRSGSSKGR